MQYTHTVLTYTGPNTRMGDPMQNYRLLYCKTETKTKQNRTKKQRETPPSPILFVSDPYTGLILTLSIATRYCFLPCTHSFTPSLVCLFLPDRQSDRRGYEQYFDVKLWCI